MIRCWVCGKSKAWHKNFRSDHKYASSPSQTRTQPRSLKDLGDIEQLKREARRFKVIFLDSQEMEVNKIFGEPPNKINKAKEIIDNYYDGPLKGTKPEKKDSEKIEHIKEKPKRSIRLE